MQAHTLPQIARELCCSGTAPRPVLRRTVMLAGLGNYIHPTTRHSIGQFVLAPLIARAEVHDRNVRAHIASIMARRRPEDGLPSFPLPDPAEPQPFRMVRAAKGWLARVTTLVDTMPNKGMVQYPKGAFPPQRFPLVMLDMIFYIPKALMNVNGGGLAAAMTQYPTLDIPRDVLLLHDEMERAFGKVSIKWDGSAAGHNGVRSVQNMLKSRGLEESVARVRLGIGRPPDGESVSSYVLESMPDAWLDACMRMHEDDGVGRRTWDTVVAWCLETTPREAVAAR